jgi:hypothetical protein
MVVMTPAQLNEYLLVMRNNKVQAGALEIPWADDQGDLVTIKMSFNFAPEFTPSLGHNQDAQSFGGPIPGGWKGGTTGIDTALPFNPDEPIEEEIP